MTTTVLTTTTALTIAHVQAFLDFMAPSTGQVVAIPNGNGRVLLHFTGEEGSEYRVAWISESAKIHPMNVQTMSLRMIDADELTTIRNLVNNPKFARVLGYVE